MNIMIREYLNKDLEEVNKILKDSFNISKTNFNTTNCQEVVATIDNIVVGYLLLTKVYNPIKNEYYALLDYVCVLSSYRGLGIGTKLLEYVEKMAKYNNIKYIQLTCSYDKIAAHKLYKKCGYIKRESDIFKKEIKR